MGSASEQRRLNLLPFSAKTAQSLQASLEKYSQYLEKHGEACLNDLAYTLGNKRVQFEHRTFAITGGLEGLEARLRPKYLPKRSLLSSFSQAKARSGQKWGSNLWMTFLLFETASSNWTAF